MNWSWLLNRYIVTFGGIAIAAGIWNAYVALHDDGIIEGRVLGPAGQPVPEATVILSERSLLVTEARDQVTTDQDGVFRFTGHNYHRVWLEAAKEGVGAYPQTEFRMYFKGQNTYLEAPLRLEAAAAAPATAPASDFMPSEGGGAGFMPSEGGAAPSQDFMPSEGGGTGGGSAPTDDFRPTEGGG